MTVTRQVSVRVVAWLAVGALALLSGALLGRPDLVVLGAPFAVLPLVGLARSRPLDLAVATHLDRVLNAVRRIDAVYDVYRVSDG